MIQTTVSTPWHHFIDIRFKASDWAAFQRIVCAWDGYVQRWDSGAYQLTCQVRLGDFIEAEADNLARFADYFTPEGL